MICPSCSYDNVEGMDRCENCLKPLRDLDVPRADVTGGVVRSVMEDEISELPHSVVVMVGADEAVMDVVARMKREAAGCAIVVQGEDLIGAFTERDAAQVLTDGRDVSAVKVGDVARRDAELLRETDSIAAALSRIAIERRRYVPVARADGSYTVVSASRVLEYLAREEW